MRAITEEEGADQTVPVPTCEVFSVVFDEAVDAFLRKEYEGALALFEDALRLEPGHSVCLNNLRVTRERLRRSRDAGQR